jgi:hypothetical protein
MAVLREGFRANRELGRPRAALMAAWGELATVSPSVGRSVGRSVGPTVRACACVRACVRTDRTGALKDAIRSHTGGGSSPRMLPVWPVCVPGCMFASVSVCVRGCVGG